MRFEGILSAWNQEAGHGTIRALHGGDELFVGLAAFPTDGEGPRLDEALSFEIVSGRDGRKQAVNLKRLQRLGSALREASGVGQARVRQAQRKRRLTLLGGAVVAVMLIVGGVRWWQPVTGELPARAAR